MSAEGFDVLESRVQEGHAIYLRGRLSGRLFRVSPVRDPAQPRLWCLLVERCVTAGIAGRRGEAVIATEGVRREEALAALKELETNPTKWLGQQRHRALRLWLRGNEQAPLAGTGNGPETTPPARGSGSERAVRDERGN